MHTDQQLFADVVAKLTLDPRIDAGEIIIGVKDGIVTLSGTVSTYLEKKLAEHALHLVKGVYGVVDALEVRLPDTMERSDADIARALIHAFQWDTLIPHERITVVVEKGEVTLIGEVDWWHQKEKILTLAQGTMGVKNIRDELKITPSLNAENIKEHICAEFERHALLDAARIEVETVGDRVILRGHVRSLAERHEATTAAWSIPGVHHVEDHLTVIYESR